MSTPEVKEPVKWCGVCNTRRQTYRAAAGDSQAGALCCVHCSSVIVPAVVSDSPVAPPDPWKAVARLDVSAFENDDGPYCQEIEPGSEYMRAVDVDRALATERQSHAETIKGYQNGVDVLRADLAAARAEIARLTEERERLAKLLSFSAEVVSFTDDVHSEYAQEQIQALNAEFAVFVAKRVERDAKVARCDAAESSLLALQQQMKTLTTENARLDALINNPHTSDFLEAVRTEAAHQRERWPSDQDTGKSDADWFWLVGYLAGKALSKPEKQLHHIITTAAACLNWHAHRTGASTVMRPGIEPPDASPPL